MENRVEILTLKQGRKHFNTTLKKFEELHQDKIEELRTKYGAKAITITKMKIRITEEWVELEDNVSGFAEPEIEILKVAVGFMTQYGFKKKAIVLVPDDEY